MTEIPIKTVYIVCVRVCVCVCACVCVMSLSMKLRERVSILGCLQEERGTRMVRK